jgi:hypothetical protein
MMTGQDNPLVRGAGSRGLLIGLGSVAVAGIAWVNFSTWTDIEDAGEGVLNALWTLPLVIARTWAQVIAENRARMKFFEESLELTVRGRLAGAAMDEAIEDDAEASLTDKQ